MKTSNIRLNLKHLFKYLAANAILLDIYFTMGVDTLFTHELCSDMELWFFLSWSWSEFVIGWGLRFASIIQIVASNYLWSCIAAYDFWVYCQNCYLNNLAISPNGFEPMRHTSLHGSFGAVQYLNASYYVLARRCLHSKWLYTNAFQFGYRTTV